MISYWKTRQSEVYRGFPETFYATFNVSSQIDHNHCLPQEADQPKINSERK